MAFTVLCIHINGSSHALLCCCIHINGSSHIHVTTLPKLATMAWFSLIGSTTTAWDAAQGCALIGPPGSQQLRVAGTLAASATNTMNTNYTGQVTAQPQIWSAAVGIAMSSTYWPATAQLMVTTAFATGNGNGCMCHK